MHANILTMKHYKPILLITVALLCVALTPAHVAHALNEDAGQALEIAPPVLTLTADPGDVINAQINLRNISSSPLIVTSQINDFSAKDENGIPDIDVEETRDSPYSLKPWMEPLAQLELASMEMQKLPVKISIPQDAAPGGYWSVVRFTVAPPGTTGTGVSLSASLGAYVFLRVSGNAQESMEITQFFTTEPGRNTPSTLFEQTPLNFVLRIKNKGTVHEQPVSQVRVKDMFGRDVATVNMNLERWNVLPGSIRRFASPLDEGVLGPTRLFGKYSAEITTSFGTDKKTVTAVTEFWVIPYRLIILVLVGLVLLVFIIRALLRNYNRKITSQARTSRR